MLQNFPGVPSGCVVAKAYLGCFDQVKNAPKHGQWFSICNLRMADSTSKCNER